jgi:hypothetical protein
MTDIREVGRNTTEQLLEVIRQSQDVTVETVKAWVEAVRRLTPQVPVPAAVTAASERLPKAAELYDEAFDFAEKVLARQREFTHRVLEAAAPAPKAAAEDATE